MNKKAMIAGALVAILATAILSALVARRRK